MDTKKDDTLKKGKNKSNRDYFDYEVPDWMQSEWDYPSGNHSYKPWIYGD